MGAIRAVTIITGEDANDRPLTITGLPTQKLHFDPAAFTVEVDAASNPAVPRVIVRAPDIAAQESRLDALEADVSQLQTDLADLDARLTDIENGISTMATADTIAKRGSGGELIAAWYEGAELRADAPNATLTIGGNAGAGEEVIEAGTDGGGDRVLGFYGSTPVVQPVVVGDWNSGSPSLAQLTTVVGSIIEGLASMAGTGLFLDARTNV